MKKSIMPFLLACAFAVGFSGSASAALPSVSSVISNVKSLGTKACEKGSLFSLKFSLRSFNGNLCNIPIIAKIAEALCTGAEGYAESKCHENAMKAMSKATPTETKQAEEVVEQAAEVSNQ